MLPSSSVLPVELYRTVVEHLSGPRDLYPLLFVSRFIHAEALRVLYHDLTLFGWIGPLSETCEQAPLLPLFEAKQNVLLHLIATSPPHAKLVRSLTIDVHVGNFVSRDSYDWRLASVMRQVINLHHLHLPNGTPGELLRLVLPSGCLLTKPTLALDLYAKAFPFQLDSFEFQGQCDSRCIFIASQPSITELRLGAVWHRPSVVVPTFNKHLLPDLHILSGYTTDKLTVHLLKRPLVKLCLVGRAVALLETMHPELEVLRLVDCEKLGNLAEACPNLRFLDVAGWRTVVPGIEEMSRGLKKLHTIRLPPAYGRCDEDAKRVTESLFSQLPWLERVESLHLEWRRGVPVIPSLPQLAWDVWYPR